MSFIRITNTTCKSTHIIRDFFNKNTKYFSYINQEFLPQMNNYLNPISTNLVNHYEKLGLLTTKENINTFKQVKINNDLGWFFPNIEQDYIFSADVLNKDFILKKEFEQNNLFNYILYFGKKFDTYNRNYMTIQQVLASIGGFAKFFHTGLFILYAYIGDILKNTYLTTNLKFHYEDSNNTNNNNNNLNAVSSIKNFKISNKNINIQQPQQSQQQSFQNLNYNMDINLMELKKIDLGFKKNSKEENYANKILCKSITKSRKNKEMINRYKNGKNYISKVFNICTYMNLYKDLQYIKSFVLTDMQIKGLGLLRASIGEENLNFSIVEENFTNVFKEINNAYKTIANIEGFENKLIFDQSEQNPQKYKNSDNKINTNILEIMNKQYHELLKN